MADVQTRIHQHAKFFQNMANTVPVKFARKRLNSEVEDDIDAEVPAPQVPQKYFKNPKQTNNTSESATPQFQKGQHVGKKRKLEQQAENYSDLEEDEEDVAPKSMVGVGPTLQFDASKSASISELQDRLRAKIETLRAERKFNEAQNSERRKRRRLDRMNQPGRQDAPSHQRSTPGYSTSKPTKQNSEGVIFSKFDLTDPTAQQRNNKRKNLPPQVMLKKIEAKKEMIAQIAQTDANKAVEIQKKDAWKSAIAKASGQKPKDDAKLLKKTIAREEKQKKKSTKEWNQRIQKIDDSKKARQNKRATNIKNRIQAKKDKKKGVSKHKKSRPGFEGKK